MLEQGAEMRQRLAVAAEHQAARGVAVEPMRQRRRARQPEAQCVEMILEALAALRAPMHGHAGRLVDHQHQGIAIDEPSHHLFRCHNETAITAPFVVSPPFTPFQAGGKGISPQSSVRPSQST